MKKLIFGVVAISLLVGISAASAGALRTWSAGSTLTSTDLNYNFTHIHNALRGGTHTLLVNADVDTAAAIAHTKMATPALLPKAWATVQGTCAASPCTVSASSGISGITRLSAGTYQQTFTSTRADTNFALLCTCHSLAGSILVCAPNGGAITTSTFSILCATPGGVATDSAFSILVMDNL